MVRRMLAEIISPLLALVFIFIVAIPLAGAAGVALAPMLIVVGIVFYVIVRGWVLDTLGFIKGDDDQPTSLNNNGF